MIEFLCPEGHKIRCPKEKAGRPAKCPRCGVGFRIPTIDELGLGESAVADPSLSGVEVTDVPATPPSPDASGKQTAAHSQERQIEFLCPNGHHLHGPAGLQGRAGECPECGSRFRIPIIDAPEPKPLSGAEMPAEPKAPSEEEITFENPTPSTEPEPSQSAEPLDFLQVTGDSGSQPANPPSASGGLGGSILNVASGPDGAAPGSHPLAALFIELWAARGEGSRVEVHLESGSLLLPDGYLKLQSQHDYAVFVTKDPDACSTITVVPWSSISKIIMRAVKQAPGEVVR
ncbi:MAG: hypothetical protein ACLP9L_30205 [Thermoguttaceae bacterium]